jgi:hypothetical protein
MAMPQLTDAHRKLAKFEGSWEGEEQIHPSPFDPKGGPAKARVHNQLALNGFAVVQDYEQERNGAVNFRGHGVLRWDAGQQCYVFHWFDSMGFPPSEFRGSFEGNVLTLTSQGPQGHTRAVFDFFAADRYTYKMDVSPNGQQWFPFMEGKYLRQS